MPLGCHITESSAAAAAGQGRHVVVSKIMPPAICDLPSPSTTEREQHLHRYWSATRDAMIQLKADRRALLDFLQKLETGAPVTDRRALPVIRGGTGLQG